MSSVQTPPVPAGLSFPRSGFGWLTPSLCDLFFLAVIAWSFMTAGTGWSRLLWDGDTALHIAIGENILEHRAIPVTDPFSFTMPNTPWSPWEWGTGVMFAELNRTFGLKGIAFVCGVVIAALIAILFRTMLAYGADLFLSLMLALMASNALSLHYHARPHLFTLLALGLAGWIIALDRARPTWKIWLLPPITAIAANLHPGFAILLVYLGVLAAGTGLEWLAGNASRSTVARYSAVLGACMVGALINPQGFGLYTEILSAFRGRGMTDLLQEWQAPTFRSTPQVYFMLFLLGGVAIAGMLISHKRFADGMLLIAFGYLSLTAVRHITVFVVLAAPIIARELSAYWQAWVAGRPRGSVERILEDLSSQRRASFNRNSPWVVVGLAAIVVLTPASAWPVGFDPEMFPSAMAARHPELASARLFTTDQWADYLLYANPGRQKVFYDDRLFYGEKMYRAVVDLLNGKPGSTAVLDQYRADTVLIETASSVAALLKDDARWKMVDQDKTAVLFRRAE